MAFWMSSKYAGKCAECKDPIFVGDRIVYSPSENSQNRVYCENCGFDIVGADPDKIKAEEQANIDSVRKARKKGKKSK
jgi:uncharacterized Zn finger protein (UPF0148 family)